MAEAAGFFTVVILMPDPWTVADREVADAAAGSFLGRLPSDLVAALVQAGERSDYPAARARDAPGLFGLRPCAGDLRPVAGRPAFGQLVMKPTWGVNHVRCRSRCASRRRI
jgi:hypothetical protein